MRPSSTWISLGLLMGASVTCGAPPDPPPDGAPESGAATATPAARPGGIERAPDARSGEDLLQAVTERFGRPAFVPTIGDAEADDSSGPTTQFGGRPWLPHGTDWPACKACSQAMPLFAQIDLRTLPEGASLAGAQGLLQVFHCDRNEEVCPFQDDTWEPFGSTVKTVRVIDPELPGAVAPQDLSGHGWPRRLVTGWTVATDVPLYPDLHFLDIDLSEQEIDSFHAAWERAGEPTVSGEKIGGWPYWVQNPEYVTCPKCEEVLDVCLQIGSEGHVPYMWGDAGIAHVSVCPRHLDVATLTWACY